VHSANVFVPVPQFHWVKGAEHVGKHAFPQTRYLTTAFCKKCGSSLPWEVKDDKNMVVPAGTLDEDPGIRHEQNIFWGSRASWCVETSELPKHEELPVKK
jgi:hypothetical protein